MIKSGYSSINESNDDYQEFLNRCKNNPTYQKAYALCRKYGYDLADLCYVEGKMVRFKVLNDRKKLQPEINYESHFGSKQEFEIQTIAYGTLKLDEYKEFLKQCNAAYELCKELSKLDLSKLESASKINENINESGSAAMNE